MSAMPLSDQSATALRAAFVELLEVAEDMRAYVPDYFAKKWKHDAGLDRARGQARF